MKKINYLGMMMAAAAITACTSESLVNGEVTNTGPENPDNVIGFTTTKRNMTRATTSAMETTGHWNFGVFTYKLNADGEYQTVMDNYLVGYKSLTGEEYKDDLNGLYAGFRGYAATSDTYGPSGNLTDAVSQWFYQNLGYEEYKNAADNYYKYDLSAPTPVTTDLFYMSNNDKQYLKYWDYSAQQVDFYAYAPYLKQDASYIDGTPVVDVNNVTFDKTTRKMTFTALQAGYDDPSRFEYMVATQSRKPADPDYKHDVPLTFHRLSGQVRLAFYEVVDGYDVEMIDHTSTTQGVIAKGNIFTTGKCVYDFTTNTADWTGSKTNQAELDFKKPAGTAVTADTYHKHSGYNQIANVKNAATAVAPLTLGCLQDPNSQSPTVYYCLPSLETDANGDLTFHVSYKLHSLDTDETITVTDATVVVPAANTKWESNKIYTYILKITKDANGSTGGDNDPAGLYPIVFDGLEVTDYDNVYTEWDISQINLDKSMITLPFAVDAANGSSLTGLTATLTYEEGATPPTVATVNWSSDDDNVANVVDPTTTATGTPSLTTYNTITAKAAGSADITASTITNKKDGKDGEYETATCRVTVPLELNHSSLILKVNEAYEGFKTNAPNPRPGDAKLVWTNPETNNIVNVNATSGRIRPTAAGINTIVATYTDRKKVVHTAACTVYSPILILDEDDASINDDHITKATGSTASWTTNMPASENANITWSTDDAAVADKKVNTVGKSTITVEAKAAGKTKIKVAYNYTSPTTSLTSTIKASCTVEVPLEISNQSLIINKDEHNTITVLNLPAGKNVTWATSDITVATVTTQDNNGVVKAVAAGTATITATYKDDKNVEHTATCTITVPLKLDQTILNLTVGDVQKLTAFIPAGEAVVWTTSDDTVATVDATGNVTAVATGTATITATYTDNAGKKSTATCTVTVTTAAP